MTLLEYTGLTALSAVVLWPIGYIPWAAEKNAVAVLANQVQACRGEPMRVVPCEQMEALK